MADLKPIETIYKGYRFRSRLEARWAVFFDAMGIEWEYEPEGYVLGDGTKYLPDFYIHVKWRGNLETWRGCPDGCFVEVKGKMTPEDARKIELFAKEKPILVLGQVPQDADGYITQCDEAYDNPDLFNVRYNSFCYLDGDEYYALFSTYHGEPWITGCDYKEWDWGASMNIALSTARQARFEHGESPTSEPAYEWRKWQEEEKPKKSERLTPEQMKERLERFFNRGIHNG